MLVSIGCCSEKIVLECQIDSDNSDSEQDRKFLQTCTVTSHDAPRAREIHKLLSSGSHFILGVRHRTNKETFFVFVMMRIFALPRRSESSHPNSQPVRRR
jgi:hypothetical protein